MRTVIWTDGNWNKNAKEIVTEKSTCDVRKQDDILKPHVLHK